MPVEVVEYCEDWPVLFASVAEDLARALGSVPYCSIEHVGSTSVPGLAAKPILDIDVVVPAAQVPAAIAALERMGYVHRGDLGVAGRESLRAPDSDPLRNVYVCTAGSLSLRNHLTVRDVLRERADLRARYAGVKRALASDPSMDIVRYVAGKSPVLQEVLSLSDLTAEERAEILRVNAEG